MPQINSFISSSQKSSSQVENPVWERPECWINVPEILPTEQVMRNLVAIFEKGFNTISFILTTSSGTYTVDWGDGTIENYASGIKASHTYNYDVLPESSLCETRGYKQALIQVYPTNLESNILSVSLNQGASTSYFSQPYLSIAIRFPEMTSLTITGNSVYNYNFLESLEIKENRVTSFNYLASGTGISNLRKAYVYTNYATNLDYIFNKAYQLTDLQLTNTSKVTSLEMAFANTSISVFPQMDTSNVTKFYYTFYSCIRLINAPNLNTSKCTDFRHMFNGCLSLSTCPTYDTSKGTSFENMFYGCRNIKNIPLFNTSNATSFGSMFFNCSSLKEAPFLDTSKAINLTSMFGNCEILESVPHYNTSNSTSFLGMFSNCGIKNIPLFDTSKATTLSSMFLNCYYLESVPSFNTENATNVSSMFSACRSIQTIPLFNLEKCIYAENMLDGCISLKEVPAINFNSSKSLNSIVSSNNSLRRFLAKFKYIDSSIAINLINSFLNRLAILEVFNNLPEKTGTAGCSISISGTPEISLITAEDRAIATAKGWTVIG